MQRRARVPDRSRYRARHDAVEPLAVAGGGDASRGVAHGTRADVRLEQSARTELRRRVFLEPRTDAGGVARALRETVTAWQAELPGVESCLPARKRSR